MGRSSRGTGAGVKCVNFVCRDRVCLQIHPRHSSWKSQLAPLQFEAECEQNHGSGAHLVLSSTTNSSLQVAPRHPCDGGILEPQIRPQGHLSFWLPFKCWLVKTRSKIFALGHQFVSSSFVIASHPCVPWVLEVPVHLGDGNN